MFQIGGIIEDVKHRVCRNNNTTTVYSPTSAENSEWRKQPTRWSTTSVGGPSRVRLCDLDGHTREGSLILDNAQHISLDIAVSPYTSCILYLTSHDQWIVSGAFVWRKTNAATRNERKQARWKSRFTTKSNLVRLHKKFGWLLFGRSDTNTIRQLNRNYLVSGLLVRRSDSYGNSQGQQMRSSTLLNCSLNAYSGCTAGIWPFTTRHCPWKANQSVKNGPDIRDDNAIRSGIIILPLVSRFCS